MLYLLIFFIYLFTYQANSVCQECPILQCDPPFSLNISASSSCPSADDLLNLSLLPVINSQRPQCQDKVLPWMCAALRKMSQRGTQTSCGFPAGMCGSWCSQILGCLAENATVCQNYVAPDAFCVNVTEADVIYPAVPPRVTLKNLLTTCPGLYSVPPSAEVLAPFEYGPFLELRNDPNMPRLPTVDLDVSLGFLYPPKCTVVFNAVFNHDWVGFFIFYIFWSFFTLAGFIWRRNFWPIRARNLSLVYVHVSYGFVIAIGFMERQIYGTCATCSITHLLAVSAGPIFMMPLFARSFRLYFLYKWNSAKVNNKVESDWYFDHRYLIGNRFLHGSHIINTLIGIIVASTAVYGFQPNAIRHTILDSGRCQWFQYTDEAIAYAQSQNLAINSSSPTINPYGIGPYSVLLNTCEYCTIKENIKIFATIWNYLYIVILAWIIWALRNLDDQYWLWRELLMSNSATLLLFPIMIAAIFPEARDKLNRAFGGIDFIFVAAISVVIWSYLWTICLPLILSFTPRARRFRELQVTGKLDSRTDYVSTLSASENSRNNPDASRHSTAALGMLEFDSKGTLVKVNLDIDDIINDEMGLKCLRDFEVESFKVELIEYYIRIKKYRKMKDPEEIQKEASALYHTFIKEGSPQQVNISGKVRKVYDQRAAEGFFGPVVTPSGDNSTPLFLGARDYKGQESMVELSVTGSNQDASPIAPYSSSPPSVPPPPPRSLSEDGEITQDPRKSGPLICRFTGATREVKQLIKDDFMDFKHSRFWKIFIDDLVRRWKELPKEVRSPESPDQQSQLRMSLRRQDSSNEATSSHEEDDETDEYVDSNNPEDDAKRNKKRKKDSPRNTTEIQIPTA